jgi:hypothetical protein
MRSRLVRAAPCAACSPALAARWVAQATKVRKGRFVVEEGGAADADTVRCLACHSMLCACRGLAPVAVSQGASAAATSPAESEQAAAERKLAELSVSGGLSSPA